MTQIRVRGSYMATSDEDKCVALYYFENNTYTYLGKYRSHRAEITGLCFVSDTDLISVSRDGFKVTYDLDKTSIRNGVVLKSRERCERTGTQTTSSCCDIKNNTLITSSTDQKFVNWSYDGSSYECTLLYVTSNHSATHPLTTFYNHSGTTLGPQEDVVTRSSIVNGRNLLAFACEQSGTLGLVQLPLTGNSRRSTSLIAHKRVHDMVIIVLN